MWPEKYHTGLSEQGTGELHMLTENFSKYTYSETKRTRNQATVHKSESAYVSYRLLLHSYCLVQAHSISKSRLATILSHHLRWSTLIDRLNCESLSASFVPRQWACDWINAHAHIIHLQNLWSDLDTIDFILHSGVEDTNDGAAWLSWQQPVWKLVVASWRSRSFFLRRSASTEITSPPGSNIISPRLSMILRPHMTARTTVEENSSVPFSISLGKNPTIRESPANLTTSPWYSFVKPITFTRMKHFLLKDLHLSQWIVLIHLECRCMCTLHRHSYLMLNSEFCGRLHSLPEKNSYSCFLWVAQSPIFLSSIVFLSWM